MADVCGAPSPSGNACVGFAGHLGLHGVNSPLVERWTDQEAERAAHDAEGQGAPQEPASGPLQVFRGVVHTVGREAFRGVVTLLDGWVYVELVGTDRAASNVSAVFLPVHEVGAIDVATEQADRL